MSSVLTPHFQRLAWSNLAAQSAEQLSQAAVPIVAVLALGSGAGEIGVLGMAQALGERPGVALVTGVNLSTVLDFGAGADTQGNEIGSRDHGVRKRDHGGQIEQ